LREVDLAVGTQECSDIKSGGLVLIRDLHEQTDLNGMMALAVQYMKARGRWKVLLQDGSKKGMKPRNLVALAQAPATWLAPTRESASSFRPTHLPDMDAAVAPSQQPAVGLQGRTRQQLSNRTSGRGLRLHYVHDANHCKMRLETGSGCNLEQILPNVCQHAQLQVEDGNDDSCTVDHECPTVGNAWPLTMSQAAANFSKAAQQLAAALSPGKHIKPGERVRMKGLQVSTEMNNQLGTAVEWSAALERWKVRLDNGRAVTIKPPNLDLCSFSVDAEFATNTLPHEDFSTPALEWHGNMVRL